MYVYSIPKKEWKSQKLKKHSLPLLHAQKRRNNKICFISLWQPNFVVQTSHKGARAQILANSCEYISLILNNNSNKLELSR